MGGGGDLFTPCTIVYVYKMHPVSVVLERFDELPEHILQTQMRLNTLAGGSTCYHRDKSGLLLSSLSRQASL